MTISYNLDISSSNAFTFLRIVFRWRGSVWKSVRNEFVTWTVLYYCVFVVYRYALSESGQKAFEEIGKHIDERVSLLPITFMLGFFVTIVFDRWKQIFQNIGFVDSPAFFICTYIRGETPQIKAIRRTIIRYLCLTQVLVLRDISIQVRKRFPNMESLVDSEFLELPELDLMEKVQNEFPKYWMPINWIFSICFDLRKNGIIETDLQMNTILQECKLYREKLQNLCNYDWVPVPLAYPQVVFLAVRIYFLLCLLARQYRLHDNEEGGENQVDRVVPLMTMLQLIFVMGWLKVAEALLNPLGEDDDDFECNYIIDRNIGIALTMVDECYDQRPPQWLENSVSKNLKKPLYAENSAVYTQNPLVGSATLCNLREANEHVRMVQRRPSDMGRRHSSNLPSQRPYLISPKRLRFRHSLPIRPAELPIVLSSGWYENASPELKQSISPSPSPAEVRHLDPVKEDEELEVNAITTEDNGTMQNE
uniref:Bestrophin homolog n=1 Tax=Globodera pallida TaxID=36090 RepID=A0A183CDN9_GLOPA